MATCRNHSRRHEDRSVVVPQAFRIADQKRVEATLDRLARQIHATLPADLVIVGCWFGLNVLLMVDVSIFGRISPRSSSIGNSAITNSRRPFGLLIVAAIPMPRQ
jgi:hypothetical protein